MSFKVSLPHSWDKVWSVGEEMVHLFQRALSSFRQNRPEEQRIGEVTDLW